MALGKAMRGTVMMLFFVAGAACGPIYDTNYIFRAPDNPHGLACISNCETIRYQCRQLEDNEKDRCEEQSRWEIQRCEDRLRDEKDRSPKWYECGGLGCSADYESCEAQYRSCYISCGGKVDAEQRCIANCQSLQKLQPQAGPQAQTKPKSSKAVKAKKPAAKAEY